MDALLLKKLMAENPLFRNKCFIVSLSQADEPAQIERGICRVLGENNVEGVEFITDKLILVTVNDIKTKNSLLATTCVKNYVHIPMDSSEEQVVTWVHPLAPVPALMKANVSGIPYVVVTNNMPALVQEMCEAFPSISEVKFEFQKWRDSSLNNGNILMSFVTNDLAAVMQEISGTGKTIHFFGFYGKIFFKEASPYVGSVRPIEKHHQVSHAGRLSSDA